MPGINFLKWFIASLIMPFLVLLFGRFLNQYFVLLFWPSSLVLLSLGAEKRPLFDVIFVWVVGVCLNILLYLLIGFLFYFVLRYFGVENFKSK